jgi:inosine-uridine nucleoside N-ribohydrolase
MRPRNGRIVPEVPPPGGRIRLVIDTDVANEIDDLYAIALALASPERFDVAGISAAHFNNGAPGAGPDSIERSAGVARELLDAAGATGKIPVLRGSQPIRYYGYPSESEGASFIIAEANKASPENPLWVVILGAATTTASALLLEPSIFANIRCVFHARSEYSWPERSLQFNVKGDIHAARSLLACGAPLIWFDTGTHLSFPYETTKTRLAPAGVVGSYLHAYRDNNSWYAEDDKGFYDLADICYLLRPGLCRDEVIPAPAMDETMFFDHAKSAGHMRRVYDIDVPAARELFLERMIAAFGLR